jgi:Outer membrane lipoprotein-sorting protein
MRLRTSRAADRVRLAAGCAAILLSMAAAQAPRQAARLDAQSTADAIMEEADRVNHGFIGERVSFTMVLVNAQGDRTERRFTLEIKENRTDGNQSRIEFDWPENVRGTILLTHAHKAADDDRWLFLPATKRSRRIAAANKSGAFMGSEFTYEDLTPFVLAKYSYTRLPDATVEGTACFTIERKQRGEGSGYSREIVWLNKDTLMPVNVEYYDRKNDLLKVAAYRGDRLFGAYHRNDLVRMENRQTRRMSELRAGARELGVTIDAQRLNSQALGQ